MTRRLDILNPHLRSRALEKPRSDAYCAPIDKLPIEILGEIFLQCVINDLYSSYEYPIPGECDTPMTLSWVSRHWRMVALSNSLLWSSMVILPQFECNTAPDISIVELWIERSATAPLCFHLQRSHAPDCTLACKCGRAAHILDFLILYVQRWKSVTLEMEELTAQHFIKLHQMSVPALESLEMCIQSEYCTNSTTEKIIATISPTSFLNLRRFSWQYLGISPALGNIPWSQLSQISLCNSMGIQECLRYLEQCSQAVSIELEDIRVEPSGQDLLISCSPTILPNLQQLKLKAYSHSMRLLKHLMTPKLNTLFLNEGCSQRKAFDALPEFLSLCSVNTLTIVQQCMHVEDIIDILKSAALQSIFCVKVSAESVAQDENRLRNSETLDKAISSRLIFKKDNWPGRLFVGWNNL